MSTLKDQTVNAVSDGAANTKTAVAGSFSKITEFIKNKPLVVVTGLIVTVVIGSIVAWLIYWLIKNKVLDNKAVVLKESQIPISGLSLIKCNGNDIPESANGKRFTFSFWIYIHNLDKNSGVIRHVLHRGDEKSAIGGSPTVFLDSNTNKRHIIFDTISKNSDDPADLSSQSADIQFKYAVARRGITVDYVPLQRWVQIGTVVNEDSNGGSISSYVDGELVKSSVTSKTTQVGSYTVSPKIYNLALDRKGDVFVGGTTDAASGIGFSGLVSNIQFFNYDLNAKDMYTVYAKGPIYQTYLGKLSNMLGLGIVNQYGVRNPIYKKTDIQQ